MTTSHKKSFRDRVHTNLDPAHWPHKGLSSLNKVIAFVVLLCVVSAILETEPLLSTEYATIFTVLNRVFLYLFSVEYLLRVWAMGKTQDRTAGHPKGTADSSPSKQRGECLSVRR